MSGEFERIAGPFSGEAHGPVWDGEAILFCLPGENKIVRYHPGSSQVSDVRRFSHGTRGLAFDRMGTLLGCQTAARRVARFNVDGSSSMLADRIDGELHNRPYDLAVDVDGGIWFTDADRVLHSGVTDAGIAQVSVLKLEWGASSAWTLRCMTTDTHAPRGIAISADGQTLYVTDNPPDGATPVLRSYTIEKMGRNLGHPRVLCSFTDAKTARGICLDRAGNIVVCLGGGEDGAGVATVSPAGELLARLVPELGEPTNCVLGDESMTTLYLTSANGCLYRMRGFTV